MFSKLIRSQLLHMQPKPPIPNAHSTRINASCDAQAQLWPRAPHRGGMSRPQPRIDTTQVPPIDFYSFELCRCVLCVVDELVHRSLMCATWPRTVKPLYLQSLEVVRIVVEFAHGPRTVRTQFGNIAAVLEGIAGLLASIAGTVVSSISRASPAHNLGTRFARSFHTFRW